MTIRKVLFGTMALAAITGSAGFASAQGGIDSATLAVRGGSTGGSAPLHSEKDRENLQKKYIPTGGGGVVYVDGDHRGPIHNGTGGNPFTTIDEAICATRRNDVILIRACEDGYRERICLWANVWSRKFIGIEEGVVLHGGENPFYSVVSAFNADLHLENLTLTSRFNRPYCGGGIEFQSVTGNRLVVKDCVIHDVSASVCGGGIFARGGKVVIDGCEVLDCTVDWMERTGVSKGGGIFIGSGTRFQIKDCHVHDCTTRFVDPMPGAPYDSRGGGIAVCGTAYGWIRNCIVEDCSSDTLGGGLYIDTRYGTEVRKCIIRNNRTSIGGGVCSLRDALLAGCLFYGNRADLTGGAIFLSGVNHTDVRNCTIADNHVGTSHAAAGIYADGPHYGHVLGCIVTDRPALSPRVRHAYCCINEDPRFVGPRDYHIGTNSPCHDALNPMWWTMWKDADGDPVDEYPDVGWDEFSPGRIWHIDEDSDYLSPVFSSHYQDTIRIAADAFCVDLHWRCGERGGVIHAGSKFGVRNVWFPHRGEPGEYEFVAVMDGEASNTLRVRLED